MAGLAGVGRRQAPNVRTCLVTFGDLASAGPGAEPYEGALEEGADQLPWADVPEELPAFVMYTSGTTGRPKGAVLTHFNLLMNTLNMIVGMGIQDDDRRGLSGLPLFHTGGLNGILPYLLLGGTSVILPSGQFDAEQVVDMREAERSRPATSCRRSGRPSVPCRARPGRPRPLGVAAHLLGASVEPPSVLAAMAESFPGIPNYNAFGQTEMSSVTCVCAGRMPCARWAPSVLPSSTLR